MKRTKNQKGITLVALIITIIVLLILAMVAIRAVQGDGIIAHAKKAKEEQIIAQDKEKINLALNEWKIVEATTDKTFESFMKGKFGADKVQSGSSENEVIITLESGNQYKVTKDGAIIKMGENEKEKNELNEYGFYYGTPYQTNMNGQEMVIVFSENNTAQLFTNVDNDLVNSGENFSATYSKGKINVNIDDNNMEMTISEDGNTLYTKDASNNTIELKATSKSTHKIYTNSKYMFVNGDNESISLNSDGTATDYPSGGVVPSSCITFLNDWTFSINTGNETLDGTYLASLDGTRIYRAGKLVLDNGMSYNGSFLLYTQYYLYPAKGFFSSARIRVAYSNGAYRIFSNGQPIVLAEEFEKKEYISSGEGESLLLLEVSADKSNFKTSLRFEEGETELVFSTTFKGEIGIQYQISDTQTATVTINYNQYDYTWEEYFTSINHQVIINGVTYGTIEKNSNNHYVFKRNDGKIFLITWQDGGYYPLEAEGKLVGNYWGDIHTILYDSLEWNGSDRYQLK